MRGQEKYDRSKKGLPGKIYAGQRNGARIRGRAKPDYTLDELRKWLNGQVKWHLLYENWVNSGYDSEFKPSIDRIDSSKSYTLDNIQLMTWQQHKQKTSIEQSSPVDMLDMEGCYLRTFQKLRDAASIMGVDRASIHRVSSGKQKSAGGYRWVKSVE